MTAESMTTLRLLGTAPAAVIFLSCTQQQDNSSVVPPPGSIVTAGWILNPQNLKPATKMPPTLLDTADLHSPPAFLETLS
jgi:hypothetical protein